MSLQHFFILFPIAILTSTACSVYESSGRKTFEKKAPDQAQASASTSQKTEKLNSENEPTCWIQPASDALWHVDAQVPLTVTAAADDQIQVCFQSP